METGGETGDCLTAERADTAPGSPKMLRDRYRQVRNGNQFVLLIVMQKEKQPLKQNNFLFKGGQNCVCVYLVQVCLAACAESPLALVSLSDLPHLLLESARTAQTSMCVYVCCFDAVCTDQSSHCSQLTCRTAVRLVSVPRLLLSAITKA